MERVIPIEEVMKDYTEEIHVHFFEGSNSEADFKKLLDICEKHPGTSAVILCISCLDDKYVFVEAGYKHRVTVTAELLEEIRQELGEKRYRLRANDKVPEPRRQFKYKKKSEA